ncbi:MAG: GTPase Era [Firmicutes bacterium]|nr:GTPase Era [Bacillota bacterium]MCL5039405.1 GTPase Era [Bacillota bacterium]
MQETNFRSGFAAVVGRPNVGKSTLVNALIGQKIAIVSDKPQTTRNRILGVLTRADAQIIFLDTPGIHRPQHKLGRYMVGVAKETLTEVDVILLVVEATTAPGAGDHFISSLLRETKTPVFLAVNKIDRVKAAAIPGIMAAYSSLADFAGVLPISALQGENLDRLTSDLLRLLPAGPMYYPPDQVTDQPERVLAGELIREKVLQLTRDEVPHSVAVEVEEFREKGDFLYIRALLYAERESQKGILVGEGGRRLKEIGTLARQEMESLFGNRIYLDIWVKLRKDWRNQETSLRGFGYDLNLVRDGERD